MTTDGTYLIVTELSDPFQVNPLKYGSSEADPDPIKALFKIRNEVYALNRYTIEVFDNVGGTLFPFQRIEGAQIQKGTYGTHTACTFTIPGGVGADTMAFLGSGRNEPPGIYLAANGNAQKISTREIDTLLSEYTEPQLSGAVMESRIDKGTQHLMLHMPDRTYVYDAFTSQQIGQPVWFFLTSTLKGFQRYRAKNLVWCYNQWNIEDSTTFKIGRYDDTIGSHWGDHVRWDFGTPIVYNSSKGALINELELVSLTGRVAVGSDPYISTSYSIDGLNWSQDKYIKAGTNGNTRKRLTWLQQGHMRNWRIQRFRGDSQAFLSFARLEAQVEALA
jgi:hypothetical protein